MAGVAIAFVTVTDTGARAVAWLSIENGLGRALGSGGYQILGLACFGAMAATLWNVARQRADAK